MRRAVINLVDSSKKLQKLQVDGLAGEVLDEVDHFQQFGFTSTPVKPDEETGHGAEVILTDLGSDIPTVIATDDRRYRPKNSNEGDVVLYSIHDDPSADHDSSKQRVVLKGSDGSILIKSNSARIQLLQDNTITLANNNASISIAPNGEISINCVKLIVNGDIETTGTVKNNSKNIGSTHTHGGVQSGSGTTGVVS